jgi:uncharacterized protein (TIGR00369 family)
LPSDTSARYNYQTSLFILQVWECTVDGFERRVLDNFARQAFMATLGASVTSARAGEVEIRFLFHPSLTQQNDFVHAGAITSILDSACGYAALSVAPEGHDVLSVEFKVNLLAPAVGEEFRARAQVKRAGKTLIVCTADAFACTNGEEKLVATMLATIMAIKPKE